MFKVGGDIEVGFDSKGFDFGSRMGRMWESAVDRLANRTARTGEQAEKRLDTPLPPASTGPNLRKEADGNPFIPDVPPPSVDGEDKNVGLDPLKRTPPGDGEGQPVDLNPFKKPPVDSDEPRPIDKVDPKKPLPTDIATDDPNVMWSGMTPKIGQTAVSSDTLKRWLVEQMGNEPNNPIALEKLANKYTFLKPFVEEIKNSVKPPRGIMRPDVYRDPAKGNLADQLVSAIFKKSGYVGQDTPNTFRIMTKDAFFKTFAPIPTHIEGPPLIEDPYTPGYTDALLSIRASLAAGSDPQALIPIERDGLDGSAFGGGFSSRK